MTDVFKITDWKARRSGGRITINGKDEAGQPFKAPNIDTIEPTPAGIIATDKGGDRFLLATA